MADGLNTHLHTKRMDNSEKSVEIAVDLCKQLIAISGGMVVFSVTFLKDLLKDRGKGLNFLLFAWVFLLLSMLAGFVALEGIIGHLMNLGPKGPPNLEASTVQGPAAVQFILFLTGVVLLVIFAVINSRLLARLPTTESGADDK